MTIQTFRLATIAPMTIASAAAAQPAAAPGWMMTIYANVTDPVDLAFAPSGALFVGHDNAGSGGGNGDPVKIHRVGPGGSPMEEYDNAAVNDPDAVGYDEAGAGTGTPGSVLIGGVSGNSGKSLLRQAGRLGRDPLHPRKRGPRSAAHRQH